MTPTKKLELENMAEKQSAGVKKAPNKHATRLQAEARDLERKISDAMYVDDIGLARKLMDEMRNEPHVQKLRADRDELAFLLKRLAQLTEVSDG